MAEQWDVDGPRILEIGGEQQPVQKVVVGIVAGSIDLVADPQAESARVEVAEVVGLPLRISWDGSTLKILHGKQEQSSVLDTVKQLFSGGTPPLARISVAAPAAARATINTVSAPVVVAGLRRGLAVNTVSGGATITDITGDLKLNTVSGDAECTDLDGAVNLNSVSGQITVTASAVASAKANTVSGDIALDLTGGRLQLRSNSVSGDVTVRAPLTGYAVTASSMSGHVVVDGQNVAKGADGNRTIRFGDELLVVKANSVSGNVVVLRATQAPQDTPPSPAGPWSSTPQDAAAPATPPADAQAGEGR